MSLGVVISGILSIGLLKTNYEDNIRENLIENATMIKHLVEMGDSHADYEKFILGLSDQIDTRITLIDGHGVVLVDSEIDAQTLDNHSNRPEVRIALNGEVGISKRYSDSVKNERYYVAIPVDAEFIKVVRVSIPLKALTSYTDKVVGNILIAAFAGVLLATLLGIRFLNMFTGPLADLTEATQSIARGNFGEQVYISSNDEIGQLAQSFNIMSLELDKRIDELKESNMTNYAILKSMINGVIAVDNDLNIMFINKAAQQMFKISEMDLKHKNVIQAFKNHPLHEMFDEKFTVYGNVKTELTLEQPQRVLKVFSNVIRDREHTQNNMGLLLSFVDITQMRQLENMRKDFVANVSHELKTPLTSIQGFIETLKEGAADEKVIRDKFIDIIDIEAKRLRQLIDDILILSDIEKSNITTPFSDVDLNDIVKDIKDLMEHIGSKKSIEVIYDLPEKLSMVKGNKVWLKQMLINLIDNGIKYTPEGGHVWIEVKEKPINFEIIVKDDGIGISEEHLDRLFERFYRVDKARSKKVGGTGLGLAIVKHIVLSMKGTIQVESEVDKGTIFTVTLPKYF
ncbi:MAG: HAMP domain-containing protein [Clostridia bacterium]|nr:HAMP domain-containing protein [Clostridia bacterium]